MIRILTKKHQAICFVALLSWACSSRPSTTAHGTQSPGPERLDMQVVMDAGAGDGASGVSEAQARALLDRMFREAGLRIVNDVPFIRPGIEVTLDGYDPERDVGYEYIASAELGVEVDVSERAALQEHPRIFLSAPASRDQLQASAETFLAALADPASPDGLVSPAP